MMNQALCTTFAALSDPIRLSIIERLAESGELSAGEISDAYAVSRPAISRHLNVLEQAGLVERRVDRKFRKFRLRPQAVDEAQDWFDRTARFWESSLDRLEKVLAEADSETLAAPQPEGKDKDDDPASQT